MIEGRTPQPGVILIFVLLPWGEDYPSSNFYDESMENVDRRNITSAWLITACVVVVLLLVLMALGRGAPYVMAAIVAIVTIAVGTTTWALLRTRRARRAYEQQLVRFAADRAVQAERLRIARDLHDLASHGLGLMTVRAATANLTADDDDAERRQALRDIEQLSRETTSELRSMLALLRTTGAEHPVPLRPTQPFPDLPSIFEEARNAGLVVTYQQSGLRHVAPAIQLTICVLVREGLTNALRHAGHTSIHVTIERSATGIAIDIQDEGPAPGWSPSPGAGMGLRGLEERLGVHHGTLKIENTSTGFHLLAKIPGGSL